MVNEKTIKPRPFPMVGLPQITRKAKHNLKEKRNKSYTNNMRTVDGIRKSGERERKTRE